MMIALAQMTPRAADVAHNLGLIAAAMAEAAAAGAALLLLPELVVPGYGADAAMTDLAEPADGPQVQELTGMARRHGVALVAGFAERAGGQVYNSALFTDGARQIVYRKSHLYGDYERGLFSPGPARPVTFGHAGLNCGMLICYDVEFPENMRRLALAGADLVLVPTALPAGGSSAFVTGSLVPVRAFENQIFVAYADLCGNDGRFSYAGGSLIAAPDGTALARAGQAPALLLANLRPADYAQSRTDNPYLADLRRGL